MKILSARKDGSRFRRELPVMLRGKRPSPVLTLEFLAGTLDDQLRQPVFLGLRTDKPAKDVVREQTLCCSANPSEMAT
jgi:ATP-dependent DNA ligase